MPWHHCERRRQEHKKATAHVPAFPALSFVRKLHDQYLTWPITIKNGLSWNRLTGKLT